MKFTNTFRFTAALFLMGVMISCEAGLDGLNDNPNAPSEVPLELVLPQAIENSVDRLYSMDGLNGYVGAVWAQSYAKIQYTEEDRYDFAGRVTLINNIWESFYSTTLKDLYAIRDAAIATENPNSQAIAEILIAWNFQQITDIWGDIPYSEAIQGLTDEGEERIISPAYDPQSEVYSGILTTLEDAVNRIDIGAAAPGQADLIYGGDMSKWEKFGNSLRLRIYLRMSEVNEADASAGISNIIDNGLPIFESHDDNAQLNYLAFPSNNPVNEFARTREDHKISNTALSILAELDDPRMRIYAVPMRTQDAEATTEIYTDSRGLNYQGVINASVDNSISLSEASTMGHYFMAPTSPGRIMTYNEVLFIRAEAAARGWTTDIAEIQYTEAVEASLSLYSQERIEPVLSGFAGDAAYNYQGFDESEFPEGITEQEITDYLIQPEVLWDIGAGWSEGNQETLGIQKWLGLFGQGLETWFEWRRLGYPELTPGPEAVLDEVPRRLSYPAIEQSLNNANRQEAIQRQGADNFLTRVWWDEPA
ncbi:MAG: SusD/RagB family nutrient-binding outer membrane lipoprotein [Balneolaceae bacterium]